MGAVVSFQEQKRAKEWETEKALLHTLSMEDMIVASERFLVPISRKFRFRNSFLEEVCMDLAVETFLYAGKQGMSSARSGKLPTDTHHVHARIIELKLFISDWIQDKTIDPKRIANGAAQYVEHWWHLGFETGQKRVKSRL